MMSNIKGRDTTPERVVRRYLHASGLRFRLHDKALPGRPDIVLPRYCSVVLVHGCFWHRHPGCRFTTTPTTRSEVWFAKFVANVNRDRRDESSLAALGWRVFTIWECETRNIDSLDRLFWSIVAGRLSTK